MMGARCPVSSSAGSAAMARYKDGLKIPTEIWEAAAMHHLVTVECAMTCKNIGIFQPHALWWHFFSRGWQDSFKVAQHRFYCQACSQRAGFRVKRGLMDSISRGEPNRPMPLPPEREWTRFLSRHKG